MMFIRYESFREYIRFYPVNTVILAIIVLVHVGFAIASAVTGVPVDFLKIVYGAFYWNSEAGVVPEYWRYVTSVFMHADFGHLLFNAFAVFVFAPPLERALGKVRYSALFLFSGIFGNIFTNFYSREVLYGLGASGAVYGVFGAYLYIMILHRGTMDVGSRRTLQSLLGIGIVYSIIIPQVNLLAHLGGLIGGFLLALSYAKLLEGRGR
ncbi:rhomboid family intramembrane serine protease [Paenibacillus sp. TRM 82003]|nr:rhomboid family intramembrane serine protease [Paenibacillus sp. TRM 82003]